MTEDFTLQHADVPQPALIDADPVSDAPWPMPPVAKWEPKPARSLRDTFADMARRVGL